MKVRHLKVRHQVIINQKVRVKKREKLQKLQKLQINRKKSQNTFRKILKKKIMMINPKKQIILKKSLKQKLLW